MMNEPGSMSPALHSNGFSATHADERIREPLAIIGIGCHFPGGAVNPPAFWELLCSEVDATREVPIDRWDPRKFYDPDPHKSGKMHTFRGGYLDRIDQFDAHFFGISPREAMWLDPQQRLLLQVAWEAFEDAGQVAPQLEGTDTGVFIGGFTLDYQTMQNFGVFSRYELQTHSAIGMMMTMLANRISYTFGLHGPSMAVDTACSGSLVAVHLACQSLWNGECSLALAGGANIMLAPTMTIAESKGGFLAPDGRCKAFDVAANGYARGEGAGVVLIKPLSRAQADHDPIYALIRGTAVTQDGHTNGITVPNGAAQERVMRLAYQRAGVAPKDIQYVEAHGTGTPVGDPIEAQAIGSVVSRDRPEQEHCLMGSVKTNIGHLEAAAGVAGLIKTALSLQHRQIPPHLHLHHPNPAIPFEQLQLRVPTTLEPWPATDGPALAGVNSFGFGGTNAHVVLQEAPPTDQAVLTPESTLPYIVPLSARSPESLHHLAERYRAFLAQTPAHLRDIAATATLRRSHHDYRLALVASSKDQACQHLDAFLASEPCADSITGRVPLHDHPKVAFVCSGMGPQWWAMGRDLIEREPVFRASIERCDQAFRRLANWSLMEALTVSEADSRMSETEVAQPANFAIQVALAALWRSWGIQPDAIIGHSAGEIAAHYLAGSICFEDAVCIIYHRSRLQQRTSGTGRMLAVGMTPETLNQVVQDTGNVVSVAAINSPSSVTLVGDTTTLETMAEQLATFHVFHRFVAGKVPYHSHFMEPLRQELYDSLVDIHPQVAHTPLYSTVTGTRIHGNEVDADYWWNNVRAPVLFAAAFEQMLQDDYNVFIELSPHPVLASAMTEMINHHQQTGTVVPSLHRREQDHVTLARSLGTLYTCGCPITWQSCYPCNNSFVRLPTYAWHLKEYWTESVESREDRLFKQSHPLLGQRMSTLHPTWECEINTHLIPYLLDHRIQENVLVPGAAFIEMVVAATRALFGEGCYVLEDFVFRKALFLTKAADPRLYTVINTQRTTIEIYSYTPTSEPQWVLHATARLRQRQPGTLYPHLQGSCATDHHRTETAKAAFYERSQHMGFQYGPTFQSVEHVYASEGSVLGHLCIPTALQDELEHYTFHPALLDAAFQVLLAGVEPTRSLAHETATVPYLPVQVDRIQIVRPPVASMQVLAHIRQADDQVMLGDIQVVDQDGHLLVDIEGFRAQSLESSIHLSPEQIDRSLYELAWHTQERCQHTDTTEDQRPDSGGWLIFMDRGGVGAALTQCLEAQGESYIGVSYAQAPTMTTHESSYTIDPTNPTHFHDLLTALTSTVPSVALSKVVHLWSLDSTFAQTGTLTSIAQTQEVGCMAVVYLMQALSQSGWTQLPPVWLVTRNAQAIVQGATPIAVDQAPLWGLGRVIGHQEFTSMWGGLIDLDQGSVAQQGAMVFDEIYHATDEDQIAFRAGQRYVARLVPSTHVTPAPLPAFRSDGTYLITGGLGTLGLLVAHWMVTHGAKHLLLMGRTPVPPRTDWHQLDDSHPHYGLIQSIKTLEGLGATIHLAPVDVGDADQLAMFLATYLRAEWPPIRGVIHAAGVVQDELLLRMEADTFQRVLRPKVHGAWLLHDLLKDQPLDFFTLFSSTGSVIASLGQGNYAAANAFLDALASYRASLGLPALSIGWGPWSVGMVEQLRLEAYYAKRGIDLITPAAGMQILSRVFGQRPDHVTVIAANWAKARETAPQGTLPTMFALLGTAEPDSATTTSTDDGLFLQQLLNAPPAEQLPVLTAHLQELVAHVLRLDITQLSEHESLTAVGIDSMMAIEVKHRIEASINIDVSVLELLQGTTIAQLARRLRTSLPVNESALPAVAAPSLTEIQEVVEQVDPEDLERLLAELEQAHEHNVSV